MQRRYVFTLLALGIISSAPARAGVPGPCTGVFFDHSTFVAYCETHGKLSKGVEDFEEAAIDPGGKNCFPGPLGCAPNYPNFPNGIDICNMFIQDNVNPAPSPPNLQPSGDGCALYVIGTGFIGANSNKIGEDLFLQNIHASVDIVFTETNKTGVGFSLSRFQGFPSCGWIVTIYDINNNPIGSYNVPAPPPGGNEPGKDFFGVWCEGGIGRVNIYDLCIAPDAIDNIESWIDNIVPTNPVTWSLIKSRYTD